MLACETNTKSTGLFDTNVSDISSVVALSREIEFETDELDFLRKPLTHLSGVKFEPQAINIFLSKSRNVIIQDPFHYICNANNLLADADSITGKVLDFLRIDPSVDNYKAAIAFYDKAIALDSVYSYLAYYYKAFALIKFGNDKNRDAARSCLITAKAMLEKHVSKQAAKNGELSHQLSCEVHMLENLLRNIEEAVDIINRANKKIDVTFPNASSSVIGMHTAEATQQINGSESSYFNLRFYHFKTYTDVKRIYEAESVIAAIQHDATVNIVFHSQMLKKHNNCRRVWQELLPINQAVTEENEQPSRSEQIPKSEKNNLFSWVISFFIRVESTVKKKIIRPLENWWNDYEMAKKIPVKICFSCLTLTDIRKILDKLKSVRGAQLNIDIDVFNNDKSVSMHLHDFDSEKFFPKFKAKNYQSDDLTLVFSSVSQELANKILTVAPANTTLTFPNLSKQNAKKILRFTTEHHDEAVFEFNGLKKEHALKLINQVPVERSLEINFQSIGSIFPQTSFTASELIKHQINGLLDFFNLSEKKPTPWRSIILLTAYSLLQIIAGFALARLAPSSKGVLIVEGVCDAARILNVTRSRQFDLNSYLSQKTKSLFWQITTSGFSKLSAARNVASVFNEVAKSVALKNSAQYMITAAVCVLAQEGKSVVINAGIYYANRPVQKLIMHEVFSLVERLIDEATLKKILQRSFAIDVCLGEETCQATIYEEILKKIIELNNECVVAIDIFQPMLGTYIYILVISQIFSEFKVRCAEVIQEIKLPSFADILQIKLQNYFNKAEIVEICEILKSNNVLDGEDNINLQPLSTQQDLVLTYENFDKSKLNNNRLNLQKFEFYKIKIIDVCVSFYMASSANHNLRKYRFIHAASNALTKVIVKKY